MLYEWDAVAAAVEAKRAHGATAEEPSFLDLFNFDNVGPKDKRLAANRYPTCTVAEFKGELITQSV